MNKLIIFDIDGTLINTCDLEDEFYIQAVRFALGENVYIDTNWLNYKYSTDAGVFFEIASGHLSRAPSNQETQQVQDFFINLLVDAFSKDKMLCQCLPGANNIFEKIKSIGWDVAIATGCWQRSAELKLKMAGIITNDIPLAASNDDFDRKDIIQTSIMRSKNFYNKEDYSNIIYVGDMVWDKNSAEALGINFVGVGNYWNDFTDKKFVYAKDYSCETLLNYLKREL
jgi:phosphoglycolate phosphatase-like HAD superfamily hydrolase